jgi:hypothetical protein
LSSCCHCHRYHCHHHHPRCRHHHHIVIIIIIIIIIIVVFVVIIIIIIIKLLRLLRRGSVTGVYVAGQTTDEYQREKEAKRRFLIRKVCSVHGIHAWVVQL